MCDTKKCTKCGRELPLDQFYRRKFKSGNVGYQPHCINCVKEAGAEWKKNNPDKAKESRARWRKNNPEKEKAARDKRRHANPDKYRAESAKWRKNNPERHRAANAKWRKENLDYKAQYEHTRRTTRLELKIENNIRSAMARALTNGVKAARTEGLLGCSIEDLRKHLERLFQPGMTWDSYGRYGWHIDHIIPLSYFNLIEPEQQKRAWHYTNLQPLWAVENLKKSNKIIETQLRLQ